MNYQETLEWMFSRLPMYQRQGSTAFKKDLTNILAFCNRLNNPQERYPCIHVAGTNGKGSTSHMIASILQESGYKVGLYTSPHLKDFKERIRINGVPIHEEAVIDFIEDQKDFLEQQKLSFFELTVGLAFDYFASSHVDIAVVEVGLGGRLDSTNIIQPLVSVITNIGLDHTQFLGETLREIAFEKGGIIKQNTPVVIGEYQKEVIGVFKELSASHKAPLSIAEQLITDAYHTDLLGEYQLRNVKTAVQAIKLLDQSDFQVTSENIVKGLNHVVQNTGLKGRWQVLQENPKVICDTAHNNEGLLFVMNQLGREKFSNLHFVLGVVNDKDLKNILSLLPKKATYYFCKPDIPRGLDAEKLRDEAVSQGLTGAVFKSVSAAYDHALLRAGADDVIYIGGSTFVVAELDL
ncbi:folylpolyglutamate synthase/dihydrofolate synthase family protein [Lutimonas halocynthiae]|uniref:bifunctional folylpolyglutamate synthase/dihydrofolate synthase n=1 Tax=Lutimonas halocynthiae TaxID=1446477 RepID=UPI0025B2BC7C|nr:folylpolyglutamate synthase/dihydrofolate synthase family protein [Lutimonas halocynthiae]MDN3642521.1 folylpolyglutamate synthase/dihydrofolate synthase family protein [Lutimonas halocynthiae]